MLPRSSEGNRISCIFRVPLTSVVLTTAGQIFQSRQVCQRIWSHNAKVHLFECSVSFFMALYRHEYCHGEMWQCPWVIFLVFLQLKGLFFIFLVAPMILKYKKCISPGEYKFIHWLNNVSGVYLVQVSLLLIGRQGLGDFFKSRSLLPILAGGLCKVMPTPEENDQYRANDA